MRTSTATSPAPHCDVCTLPHVCKKGVSWSWTETSDVISQIRPILLWNVLLGVVSQKQRPSKHIYHTVPSVLGARQEPENVVVFLCLDAFPPNAFWPCFISYPAYSYYHLFFFKQRFFVFILQVSLHRASPYGHAICALASLCRLDCDTVFPSTVPLFTLLERYRPLSVLIVNFPWNSQLCYVTRLWNIKSRTYKSFVNMQLQRPCFYASPCFMPSA